MKPRLVKGECDKFAHMWLVRGKDATLRQVDHSLTDVLELWKDHEARNMKIADLARRRLCAQASSATLESTLSKAGLIVSKKRQRLTGDHMVWSGLQLSGAAPHRLGTPYRKPKRAQWKQ